MQTGSRAAPNGHQRYHKHVCTKELRRPICLRRWITSPTGLFSLQQKQKQTQDRCRCPDSRSSPRGSSFSSTATVALGRFILGGRVLSSWWGPAHSQSGLIRTSDQWLMATMHALSLTMNLGWKCLRLLPSQWFPFNCPQPWVFETRLRSFCSLEGCPSCPHVSSTCAQALAVLLNFPLLTWPHAHCNLLSIPPKPLPGISGHWLFPGCVSTLHPQHKPLRTRSHFFRVLSRARVALYFPTAIPQKGLKEQKEVYLPETVSYFNLVF